jgi:hypothetical protein
VQRKLDIWWPAISRCKDRLIDASAQRQRNSGALWEIEGYDFTNPTSSHERAFPPRIGSVNKSPATAAVAYLPRVEAEGAVNDFAPFPTQPQSQALARDHECCDGTQQINGLARRKLQVTPAIRMCSYTLRAPLLN